MNTEIAQKVIREIVATADVFLRESHRLFRPHGLTAAQYNVLNILAGTRDGKGLSQRELGDILVVDRSNVTGLLDRMEKCGWVRRADDAKDRRIYRVELTAKGRKLWTRVEPLYAEVVRQLTEGADQRQMQAALVLLAELQSKAAIWSLSDSR
jgi:DNA-binding MarR family transcriptional regulator